VSGWVRKRAPKRKACQAVRALTVTETGREGGREGRRGGWVGERQGLQEEGLPGSQSLDGD